MRQLRKIVTGVALASLALTACGEGEDSGSSSGDSAAAFPSKNVNLYIPYAPGGPTDALGRAAATFLEKDLGQTFVVENRAGASGSLGIQAMIGGGNDGHSLSIIAVPATATNPLQMDVGYTNEDYIPIGVISEIPSVLVVGKGSPYADAKGFFDAAKAKPDSIKVAVPGATTSQAMELKRLGDKYGVKVTPVPFNGNAEIITALLGGNVDAAFVNSSQDILPNITSGAFRPLVVSPAERVPYLKDVPTLKESGFPELVNSVSVFGLAAPKGTPDSALKVLEDSLRKAQEDPEVIKVVGKDYIPEEFIDGAGFKTVIDDILEAYGPILKKK